MMPRIRKRPKLLDLFCGVGGCSMGYHLAGFDVTGVDMHQQPNYPFEFNWANALTFPLDGYDCYHASPPCQRYSTATGDKHRMKHPDLVGVIRDRFLATGKPFVIENVPNAPLINPTILCGTRFRGLRVLRHRLFETNFFVEKLRCNPHPRCCNWPEDTGRVNLMKRFVSVVGGRPGLEAGRDAMQMGWAKTMDEVTQGIPPPYTRYIGKFLHDAINGVKDRVSYRPDFIR